MSHLGLTRQAVRILMQPEAWTVLAPSVQPVRPSSTATRARRKWSEENRHSHSHREILLCLEGEGHLGYDGELYAIRPGTAFYVAPEVPHDNMYPPGCLDRLHIWIHLLEMHAFLRIFTIRKGKTFESRGANRTISYEVAGVDAFRFLPEEGAGAGAVPEWRLARLRTLVNVLAVSIAGIPVEHEQCAVEAARPEKAIEAIALHIEKTAGRGVSLESLSRLSGYSKFHLHRLFRQYTGRTVLKHINECRMHRLEMLQRQNLTQDAIAAELGFSQASAFSRWLKRQRELESRAREQTA